MDSENLDREMKRAIAFKQLNREVESTDEQSERKRLESKYPQVWDTEELKRDFVIHGFMAPFVLVVRRSDNKKGTLTFQHMPRFYFDFQEV